MRIMAPMSEFRVQSIRIAGHREYIGQKLNFYLVSADDETVLVDSGYDNEETHAKLDIALEHRPIHRALFTHAHPDHVGGALHLRKKRHPLAFAIHSAERDIHPELKDQTIDEPLDGVNAVEIGGETLETVHTPGHTPGHLCFFHRPSGTLFTGDLVVGEGTVWVGPPHGDLKNYLDSLALIRHLPLKIIYSGHGPPVLDPNAKIDEYLAHRLMRENQILDLLNEGVHDPNRMVEIIYAAVDQRLWPVALLTVLGHLTKLHREGRTHKRDDGGWEI